MIRILEPPMLRGNIPLAACSSVRLVRPAYILPALRPICPLRQDTHPGRVSSCVHVPQLAKGISSGAKRGTNLKQKKDNPEVPGVDPGPLSVKPASGAVRLQPLLNEERLSNKEQRKADWGIMKEMARYLWPKVPLLNHWINVCGN